jgi:flavin reductase (DIM6/NTAB) family NADH-FMN oxidoreductase RutF
MSAEGASSLTTESFDPLEYRKALSCFLTGVTVVTTVDENGTPRGFTANSFTSVSLDPPLVLVCIAETAQSYDLFARTGHFAVNILSEDHREVSNLFASKHPGKFSHVTWKAGAHGAPLIDDAVAWLDCVVHDRVVAGDHMILIGRVEQFAHSLRRPLGYCRSNYLTLGLDQQAVDTNTGRIRRVGAVLEADGRVLLLADSHTGNYSLPTADKLGGKGEGLIGLLESIGISPEIEFLFAVYEDAEGALNIYYRGSLDPQAPLDQAQARLIPFDDIPWDRLPAEAMESMLRRYIDERREDLFGVYVGDTRSGDVHRLGRRHV